MKRSIAIATLICAWILAGCGKKDLSVETQANQNDSAHPLEKLIKDPAALASLQQWCTKDSTVEALAKGDTSIASKCELVDTAKWFLKNPDMLALVHKTEPWPGKSTTFFQSAMQANMAKQILPSYEQTDRNFKINPDSDPIVKKYRDQIAAVPGTAIHAWNEESAWCAAQFAWKTGRRAGYRADFSQISPACVAASEVQIGGVS